MDDLRESTGSTRKRLVHPEHQRVLACATRSRPCRSALPQEPTTPTPGSATASASTTPGSPPTAAPTAPCAAASPSTTRKPGVGARLRERRPARPNLEIFDLPAIGSLNYLCDDYGIDTMSGGCVLSFYADAIDRAPAPAATSSAIPRRPSSSSADRRREARSATSCRRLDAGRHKFGHGSIDYAMQSRASSRAYNCKFIRAWPWPSGSADRRPPQGILGHHLRAQAVRARILRAGEGPEGSSTCSASGAACSSTSSPAVSPGSRSAGASRTTQVLQLVSGSTGPRRLLDDLGPDLFDDQALLARNTRADRRMDYPPAVWFDPANVDTDGPSPGSTSSTTSTNGCSSTITTCAATTGAASRPSHLERLGSPRRAGRPRNSEKLT